MDSPDRDARLLLAHVTGREPGALAVLEEVTGLQAAQFQQLVGDRARRVPLQHLTGEAAFRYRAVRVGPGVFVPRPETEVMTGWVVARVSELVRQGRTPTVVDLCAGSGAIAAAVATEVPRAVVHAVEVSPEAVDWARTNLADTHVVLHLADAADALPELDGAVDVVVANPPYIPLDAYATVVPEVRDHDPVTALFSGSDGLDMVRVVVRTATRLLRDGGQLAIEHAEVQTEAAPALVVGSRAFTDVRDHPDLTGRPRFVTARRVR